MSQVPPSTEQDTQHVPGTVPQHHPQQAHHSHFQEAFEKLEKDVQETANAAIDEGREDVQGGSSSYLQKALGIADFGLSQAETYVNLGKEKLNAPAPGGHPQTGIAATLAQSATAALDAAHRGLGIAHQTLHEKAPHFEHAHPQGPAHPVTVPAKPVSEILTGAQASVQPHVDAAKAQVDSAATAAQPHIDAAQAAAQPHFEAAQATVQPHVDAAIAGATAQFQAAQQVATPVVAQAQEAAAAVQPQLAQAGDSAAAAASSAVTAATEAVKSAGVTEESKQVDEAQI